MSADNAGNGPITIAALTSKEISALFTLSSPFWVILLLYHPGSGWSIRQTVPRHQGEDNTPLNRKDQEIKYPVWEKTSPRLGGIILQRVYKFGRPIIEPAIRVSAAS